MSEAAVRDQLLSSALLLMTAQGLLNRGKRNTHLSELSVFHLCYLWPTCCDQRAELFEQKRPRVRLAERFLGPCALDLLTESFLDSKAAVATGPGLRRTGSTLHAHRAIAVRSWAHVTLPKAASVSRSGFGGLFFESLPESLDAVDGQAAVIE